jgi:hypothetical protein
MMYWFRENRRFGGRLALFALAVQLVLSFGHIHLEDIYGQARALASSSPSTVLPTTDGSRPLPTDRQSNVPDDYCAICATIHLLGASFVTEAPQFPLQFVVKTIEHFARPASIFITPQRPPFQSRAPPLA